MHRRALLSLAVSSAALSGARSHAQEGHQHGSQEHRHMDKRFRNPEELSKNFDNPERDAWQMPERVIAALGLQPGQSVADIGAGTGYFAVRLARSAAKPQVFAVDIEEPMVAWLKERAAKGGLSNITAILGSAESANLPQPVDMALTVNTYHHIADRKDYFSRLQRSLRPGGKLAIVDFKKGAPMGPPDEHRFPPEVIQRELADAGYSLIAQHSFLPHQTFLIFEVGKK